MLQILKIPEATNLGNIPPGFCCDTSFGRIEYRNQHYQDAHDQMKRRLGDLSNRLHIVDVNSDEIVPTFWFSSSIVNVYGSYSRSGSNWVNYCCKNKALA